MRNTKRQGVPARITTGRGTEGHKTGRPGKNGVGGNSLNLKENVCAEGIIKAENGPPP